MTTTVRVSATTTIEKEVSLPKYFKSLYYSNAYFCIVDQKSYIRIHSNAYDKTFSSGPEFMVNDLKFIGGWIDRGIEEITADEFFDAVAEFNKLMSSVINYGH